jgi:hypothetical protein
VIRARSRLRRLLVIVVPAFILIGAASAGAWYALFRGVARDTPPPDGWIPAAAILAGSGTDGLVDGRAVDAQFSDPFAVAIGPDGSTYVADGGDSNSIRRISIDGIVSTVAGGHEGFRDGIGAMARLNTPSGVADDHYGTSTSPTPATMPSAASPRSGASRHSPATDGPDGAMASAETRSSTDRWAWRSIRAACSWPTPTTIASAWSRPMDT